MRRPERRTRRSVRGRGGSPGIAGGPSPPVARCRVRRRARGHAAGQWHHQVHDERAPVAALHDEARVAQALHQLYRGAGDVLGPPAARCRLAGEPVARNRPNHHVGRVLSAAAVCRRVGEWADDVQHLHDRAGPAVDEATVNGRIGLAPVDLSVVTAMWGLLDGVMDDYSVSVGREARLRRDPGVVPWGAPWGCSLGSVLSAPDTRDHPVPGEREVPSQRDMPCRCCRLATCQ
jgi:hypothetical protein